MNNSIKFLVKEKDNRKRLDIFLSEKIDDLTRSNIKKIIESSNVKINKKKSNPLLIPAWSLKNNFGKKKVRQTRFLFYFEKTKQI